MRIRSKNSRNAFRRPAQITSPIEVPDLRDLELRKLDKEMADIETRLCLMRRQLRAVITGNRKGNGPKVVNIDMGNGNIREVKCGTLGE
jgi:hypothetical protein